MKYTPKYNIDLDKWSKEIEKLPKIIEKKNKGCTDWAKTVGMTLNCFYSDGCKNYTDIVKILSYIPKNPKCRLTIACNENTLDIFTGSFVNGNITKLFSKEVKVGDYNGKVFIKEIIGNKLKIKCEKCGFDSEEHWIKGKLRKEYFMPMSNFYKNKQGCPCCCNFPQVVIPEINSIWAKARWMCDLGVSEEDSKKYTPQSSFKIDVTCPYCKKIRRY